MTNKANVCFAFVAACDAAIKIETQNYIYY